MAFETGRLTIGIFAQESSKKIFDLWNFEIVLLDVLVRLDTDSLRPNQPNLPQHHPRFHYRRSLAF
jgi:hypothetical protein